MTYAAEVLADSVSPDGVRLTTLEVTMPRIVLAEFNTHRMFSRNSASSRAIPVEKMIRRVLEDPYIPTSWGKNQKGMQADEEFAGQDVVVCEQLWKQARANAVDVAERMLKHGVHKQLTNRLLEPFMWHTAIVTSTEWRNFFNLRCHEAAHPDIRMPAELMRAAMTVSEPEPLDYGEWHLPLIGPEDYDLAFSSGLAMAPNRADSRSLMELMVKISVARCARVSYLTHDGKRDLRADLELHDRLLTSGHLSPFEHVARPMTNNDNHYYLAPGDVDPLSSSAVTHYFSGNLRGWVPYRKTIPHEDDILGERAE